MGGNLPGLTAPGAGLYFSSSGYATKMWLWPEHRGLCPDTASGCCNGWDCELTWHKRSKMRPADGTAVWAPG